MYRRHYTMSKDAYAQRVKYGYQKSDLYSGKWTMVRIRQELKDVLQKKYGTLARAFEFAASAR
jgi:hypothetical protein